MLTGRLPYGAQVAQSQNQIAVQQAEIPLRPRRQSRDSGVDRRGAAEGRCIPIPTSATRACRNSPSIFAIPMRNISTLRRTPLIERNPTAVLEMHDRHSCLHHRGIARQPARRLGSTSRASACDSPERSQASSVAAIIGFGATPCARLHRGIRRSSDARARPPACRRASLDRCASRPWRPGRPSPRTPRRNRDICRPR